MLCTSHGFVCNTADGQWRYMNVVQQAWHVHLQALKRWRAWAPVKHAKRRHLRAAAMKLCSSKRRRVWKCLQEYTAKRRVKSAAKQQAQQHFR